MSEDRRGTQTNADGTLTNAGLACFAPPKLLVAFILLLSAALLSCAARLDAR